MYKKRKSKAPIVLLSLGLLLILLSVAIWFLVGIQQQKALQEATSVVVALREQIPQIRAAELEDGTDVQLPLMSYDGADFVAIVEIPVCGITLPVGDHWDSSRIIRYPCRFWGNVLDGCLIIGGSAGLGQFDFEGRVENGDYVYITDMMGARYTYVVTQIQQTRDVSSSVLVSTQGDLVLFSPNESTLDYTLLICSHIDQMSK